MFTLYSFCEIFIVTLCSNENYFQERKRGKQKEGKELKKYETIVKH